MAQAANTSGILPLMEDLAEKQKFLLLVPQSQGPTWDVIINVFGQDVEMLDKAFREVFSHCRVDPKRIAIAGFSDGASYALSIGLTNGDLFSSVLAFPPGFMAPSAPSGKPRVFISHGRKDNVLPIDRCSRRIVARLEAQGYAVDYEEFDGGQCRATRDGQCRTGALPLGIPGLSYSRIHGRSVLSNSMVRQECRILHPKNGVIDEHKTPCDPIGRSL